MAGFLILILMTFFLIAKLEEIFGKRIGFYIKKENLYDFSPENCIQEIIISEIDKKISCIKKIYPSFDPNDFLNKSKRAFEIIFAAYSSGDIKTLEDLLSPRILKAFSMAIDDRKKRKEIIEGILVRFISSEIINVDMLDDYILITVKFETEQSNVLKSENGAVLEGNADFVEKRTDIWSFSRKKLSKNSRWYLHEIKSQ
ncbi:MAG: Tim44/TimA family putative adaptor protein [Holosporaceae bacterium]|jgi:predicted lipid-binding transport protein (Tim44 family)|nr:Tim44/TimA family putative adaptor protein [Holosporaceae bacterium]